MAGQAVGLGKGGRSENGRASHGAVCGGETKICLADTVVDDAKAHYDLWHADGGASVTPADRDRIRGRNSAPRMPPKGGMQCIKHLILDGPTGRDCPCVNARRDE